MRSAFLGFAKTALLPWQQKLDLQQLLSSGSRAFRSTRRLVRLVARGASFALVSFCVANTVFTVVGYPACVSGASMRPALNDCTTLHPNLSWLRLNVDWVFVNCWAARRYQFDRGDIVVLISPKGIVAQSLPQAVC
jgi:signal peptidase I